MKKRFTEEQIIGFLREAKAGLQVKELCRQHGFSEASYYLWRSKFGGMSVSDAKRLKELEAENPRLKKLAGRVDPGKRSHPGSPAKKVVSAPISRQARALNLSRRTAYYRPQPVSDCDLLWQEGTVVGRLRVGTLMRRMHRKPNTSRRG